MSMVFSAQISVVHSVLYEFLGGSAGEMRRITDLSGDEIKKLQNRFDAASTITANEEKIWGEMDETDWRTI